MIAETTRPTSPLAVAIVASVVMGFLTALAEQALAGFALMGGLGGDAVVLLGVQTGLFMALSLGYGLAVAAVLGGLRRTFDVGAAWRRTVARLREDSEADVRVTAGLVAAAGSALLLLGAFLAVYTSQEPEFLAKPVTAGLFFAFFIAVFLVLAVAAFFPVHAALVWLLRALKVDRWMRSERVPLTFRLVFGALALGLAAAAWILARMLGNYEMRNVLRLPLFALTFVVGHALVMLAVYRLRKSLRGWLSRVGLVASAALAVALVALPVFGLSAFPAVRDRIEQDTFASARVASILRATLDLDGDGFAALLDGGDCDDFNAAINPDAQEIPGDGIDNDCRNGDASAEGNREFALDPALAGEGEAKAAASDPPTKPAPTREAPATDTAPANVDAGATAPDATADVATAPAAPAGLDRAKLADANLIVILVDTVRADHLHSYGYERETSPNMDALAAESIVFRYAYAQANHTPRSMPSIFTGRFPSEIHWEKLYRNFSPIKDSNVTMFEVLRDQGFTNLGVSAHWYFEPDRNLDQGFDVWDNKGAKSLADGNTLSPAPKVTKKALAHLAKMKEEGKRVAAFIHYMDPHSRYMKHSRLKVFGGNKTLLDKYDGEIYWTDHYVGELLDGLKELGMYENSVIVLFADHGEAFKDHKSYFHGMTLYREEIEVPLMIRVPGVEPREVSERVALVDIFPTVVDMFDVPFDGKLQGVSLLPIALEGKRRGRPVYSELCKYPSWKEDIRALYVGDLKIIWNKTKNFWELFDLAADPTEQQNLIRSHPKAEAMKKALLDWMDTQLGD